MNPQEAQAFKRLLAAPAPLTATTAESYGTQIRTALAATGGDALTAMVTLISTQVWSGALLVEHIRDSTSASLGYAAALVKARGLLEVARLIRATIEPEANRLELAQTVCSSRWRELLEGSAADPRRAGSGGPSQASRTAQRTRPGIARRGFFPGGADLSVEIKPL